MALTSQRSGPRTSAAMYVVFIPFLSYSVTVSLPYILASKCRIATRMQDRVWIQESFPDCKVVLDSEHMVKRLFVCPLSSFENNSCIQTLYGPKESPPSGGPPKRGRLEPVRLHFAFCILHFVCLSSAWYLNMCVIRAAALGARHARGC